MIGALGISLLATTAAATKGGITVHAYMSKMWTALGAMGTFIKWVMIAVGTVLLVVVIIQYLFAAMRGRHKEHRDTQPGGCRGYLFWWVYHIERSSPPLFLA